MKKASRKTTKPARKAATAHREFSSQVTEGVERAPSRAMLHAVGFTRQDFKKNQVGIAEFAIESQRSVGRRRTKICALPDIFSVLITGAVAIVAIL